jgi:MYXO-CTERM domain-containing protein
MNAKVPVVLIAVALPLLSAVEATAHPGYPLVVETTLDLSAIFDPGGNGMGCHLCHTDPNGGSPLRPFGSLLVQSYGLSSDPVNEDDPSLVAALDAMEKGPDARLITDIKNGVDPNTDPTTAANALPQPDYGCAVSPGGHTGAGAFVFAGVAILAMGAGSRRRRV